MKPLLVAATSVCALALMSPALADCPEPPPLPHSCPADRYFKIAKDDPCGGKCERSNVPPGPAETMCHRAGNDYFCEAWPQGPELTYTWTSGGSVTLLVNGSTASTLQGIFCNGLGTGGWVQLTVTSPFGLTSMQDLAIECIPTGSGY